MRLLILGGTRFLGRAIAACALEAGDDVTCAARGSSGSSPRGARFVAIDRDRSEGLALLAAGRYDAAVDLSRHPGHARRAVAALAGRIGHWTFVSTTSVYADMLTPGQSARTAPVLAPLDPGIEAGGIAHYGAAKVACERAFGADAFICRPGLIVGPHDPSGRFAYWIARLKRGGEVLAPAPPDDPVQYIDVRDLAGWIVRAARARLAGTFDAIGPSYTRRAFLDGGAAALGSACAVTWVDQAFLDRHEVGRERGPRTLPYPMPDAVGDCSRDVSASLRAGLTVRPLAETARDTARWMDAAGGPVTGLTCEEERAILAAWHARRHD